MKSPWEKLVMISLICLLNKIIVNVIEIVNTIGNNVALDKLIH